MIIHQIKLFSGPSQKDLESQVNEFIAGVKEQDIISINFNANNISNNESKEDFNNFSIAVHYRVIKKIELTEEEKAKEQRNTKAVADVFFPKKSDNRW